GWSGGDPILTVDQLAALVADGQVRYVLMPDDVNGGAAAGFGGRGPAMGRDAAPFRRGAEPRGPGDPPLWRAERRADEADTAGPGPFGPGRPGGGAFGPPGAAPRLGWRGGFGRAWQLYDCRPEAIDTATAPAAS